MTSAASGGSRLRHWFDAQRTRRAAPTRAWYGALAFGIATLLFGIKLAAAFPATGAGFADGYGLPVIAFEFVRGQADLLAVFGRSEESRVGKGCVSTCRSWGAPVRTKKKEKIYTSI